MVKKDQVKKTKKGDVMRRFWYTLKNCTWMQGKVVHNLEDKNSVFDMFNQVKD